MHFSLFLVSGLAAVATALPQRSGGQGRFRGGRPSGQDAQGNGVQAADLSGFQYPQTGAQPPAATPGNDQAGANQGAANDGNTGNQANASPNNQGALNNQGTENNNQNGTATGNNGANQTTSGFDASLVPEFGVQAGQSPDGKGNCLGLNNVKIPCSCPPDRQLFIQKVQAAVAAGNSEGVPVKFPLDDSSASKKARIQTSIVVLQNLNGRGVGCPAAATTFLAQQAAA